MKRLISALISVFMIVPLIAAFPQMSAADYTGVHKVEAKYFDVWPVIDGIVSEEEWGEYTVMIDQSTAANIESTEPKNSSFFMRNTTAVPGYDSENLNMSYKLWIRWNKSYLYVAAVVKDPDGHSLKNGRSECWNGDGLQIIIDPNGYNASSESGPDRYDPAFDDMPWSSDYKCFSLGFFESAGGFTEAWNNTKNVKLNIDAFGMAPPDISVSPAGVTYTSDTANGYTTYEAAIPWPFIDSCDHEYASIDENENGGIGAEYGISACVFNADGTSGARTWNAALSWGSGILNEQQNNYKATCAGSNKITLVADKVSEDPSYKASFTYKYGGYYPPDVVPDYPTEIDSSRLVGPLTYDNEADMQVFGGQYNEMGGVWTTEPDGNKVVQWNEDTGDLFNSPTASRLNESDYLSSKGAEADTYSFDGQGNYTMEFDVMVTGTDLFQAGYTSTLYNWFGGPDGIDYECGYDFGLGAFILRETYTGKLLGHVFADFTLNEWHHWVFQYFKDNSEIRFYFDPEMVDGVVARTATPMFQRSYKYFDMPGVEHNEVILRRLNCQVMLDNVKFYNFVDFTHQYPNPTPHVVYTPESVAWCKDPCGHITSLVGEYATGETVTLPVPQGYADGSYFYRFFKWYGSCDITRSAYSANNDTANGRTYSFVKQDGTVYIYESYVLVGDIDRDGSITSKDLAAMKDVLVNGVHYDDIVLEAVDMNGDGSLTSGDVQAFKEYMVGKFEITK